LVLRGENIDITYCKDSNKSKSPLDGYPWLYFVENENLSDDMLESHQHIAVNVSSSRSVSLLKTNKRATIVIQANNINASVTQVMGRFRKANVDVILVLPKRNIDKRFYKKQLKEVDPFLNFRTIEVYSDISKLPVEVDIKKNQVKGYEDFMEEVLHSSMKFSSLSEMYDTYVAHCKDYNFVAYTRQTFAKKTDSSLYRLTDKELAQRAIEFWKQSNKKRLQTVWSNWEYKSSLSFRKFKEVIDKYKLENQG
jgi:DNA-binding Lrp family transcriptional regulator